MLHGVYGCSLARSNDDPFGVGDKQITLSGDPTLPKLEVSLEMIASDWAEEDEGFIVEFQHLEPEE